MKKKQILIKEKRRKKHLPFFSIIFDFHRSTCVSITIENSRTRCLTRQSQKALTEYVCSSVAGKFQRVRTQSWSKDIREIRAKFLPVDQVYNRKESLLIVQLTSTFTPKVPDAVYRKSLYWTLRQGIRIIEIKISHHVPKKREVLMKKNSNSIKREIRKKCERFYGQFIFQTRKYRFQGHVTLFSYSSLLITFITGFENCSASKIASDFTGRLEMRIRVTDHRSAFGQYIFRR